MSRFTATLSASLAAAVVAAVPAAVLAPGAGATAYVLQKVTADDLGPSGPWLRLQDDPGNAGRPPGVQEVAPFADPVRFNGSLHLAVAPAAQAQQAQAAHYFNRRIPLSSIAAGSPSYDVYVRGWTSTPAAIPYGASLQLPLFCQGAFTTLSFQPQLATDSQGRTGAVADTWRHFVAGGSSQWSTSNAVASFGAGTDHALSDYVAACDAADDGVIGVIANAGRLGDAGQSVDTYVDNLAVNGTVYEFGVGKDAQGTIVVAGGANGKTAAAPRSGYVTFASPRGGPAYASVGTRLVFSRPGGLAVRDLTVTANGKPVTLTAGSGGTLSAVVTPSATTDLGPNATYRTPFTVAFKSASAKAVALTATLLAQGYQPLQPTSIHADTQLHP
ncbi:hypothetical protein OG552_33245 [Streptomyces sp. NBC_01476]|uniref:hypothetical protein n=1 Tax=Streptomyces sp. NBC_01476 TaxID=2903881 RepID=UPI002E31F9C1|nr:hypothetical protein [Streptomyces sp. NBC_01476]